MKRVPRLISTWNLCDEIEFLYWFEADDDDDDEDDNSKNKEELSKTDEAAIDNVLDELVDMANSQDANINASADKPAKSDPLGHLQVDFNSLSAKVNNFESSLSQQLTNKLDESVPRMSTNPYQSLTRVKKTLKAAVPNLILKPLNKEFNALNTLESRRFVILQKKLRKAIQKTVGKSVNFPRDIMVINGKQLQTKVEKNATDISELVEVTREIVRLAAGEGPLSIEEAKAQIEEIKRVAELKAEKEKTEKRLKKVMTPDELRAHAERLATYEAKKENMLEEYNHCISFRPDPLPITKISYRIKNSTNEDCMRITRNRQPLNLTMYEKFVLKMLGFSECLELHDLASKVEALLRSSRVWGVSAINRFQLVEQKLSKIEDCTEA
ncbi:hypothetical protein Tco_0838617 [Tanacetum coccineum]|uniref:Uncharacterized protein n=1 Tax=Tanacetum coccineum TaxID=301880 RepID=A0ABQ5ANA9_9ASTR